MIGSPLLLLLLTWREAMEEFTELWLDQFDQLILPADTTRLLVALTSAMRNIPKKTPKRQIAAKWQEEVKHLFKHHTLDGRHGLDHKWHVAPDEILHMTQRLAAVGAKDATILAPWMLSKSAQRLFLMPTLHDSCIALSTTWLRWRQCWRSCMCVKRSMRIT